MGAKERLRFLLGEKEVNAWPGIVVGAEEMNMDKKGEWPAQL